MNLPHDLTRDKNMLSREEQKIVDAALKWRETEKEMIADKRSTDKTQAHIRAKLVLRDAADRMTRRGIQP